MDGWMGRKKEREAETQNRERQRNSDYYSQYAPSSRCISRTFAEAKTRRFTAAGFKDVKLHRIGPWWYSGVRRHGLIMGCSVTGRKAAVGESPLKLGPKSEDVAKPAVSRAAR